jgi:acyl-CoA reductase-like NAD-dependent aldehyde dehydrogenase
MLRHLGIGAARAQSRDHRKPCMNSTLQPDRPSPTLDLGRWCRSWIDGRSWAGAEGEIQNSNPYDGLVIGSTESVGAVAVAAAVSAARKSFEDSWGVLSTADRKQLLHAFADGIAAHTDILAHLETMEVGRPITDARFLVSLAPYVVRSFAALGDQIRGDLYAADDHRLGVVWRRPRGVVAAITPWNVPVMNVIERLAPALAAGNCVVVKPSESAPRSAVLLAQIATEAGLPDGAFNVVLGDGPGAGHALASHPDVDLIAFTGSTQTGLAIGRAAASSTLKPLLLECGGKSAQIMLDDAFADPAIWGHVFFSAFWNSGQWCAAKTRLIVPRARLDEAIAGLQLAASNWRLGDPSDPDTKLGPLANRVQFERVTRFVAMADMEGRLIDLGCPRNDFPARGCFVSPSLVIGAATESAIVQEEIFGPLLSLETFDDVEGAITLANATRYGLHAAVWTNDATAGHRIARSLIAGSITVSAGAQAATHSPSDFASTRYFEPQRQSGFGMDGGLHGLLAYTTAQSVTYRT